MRQAMRRAAVVGTAALWLVAGAAFGAGARVELIAASGPGVGSALTELIPGGAVLTGVDHVSASPRGNVVMVVRMAGASPSLVGSGQLIVVRDAAGVWSVRSISGVTRVKPQSDAVMQLQIGAPIVNDQGDVLAVASVMGPGPSGAPMTTPALVRLNASGGADLLLRFGVASGAGVPALPPTMTTLPFGGPAVDQWRFTDSGPLYASSNAGLLGPSAGSGQASMGFRTLVVPRGFTAPPFGTAIPVSSGRGLPAMTGAGFSAQALTSDGYVPQALSGVVMWDTWGLPQFLVRDGTTPIDGLADQFILQTVGGTEQSLVPLSMGNSGGRVAFNGSCTAAFVAKFGPIPTNTTGSPTSQPTFINAPVGLFIKEVGHSAKLVARVPFGSVLGSDAPGLPLGTRFMSLGMPVMNAEGQLAFVATVSGPALGIGPSTRSTIWTTDDAGQLKLVAMTDAPAGTAGAPSAGPGAHFITLVSEPTINRRGQIVFSGRMSAPVGPNGSPMTVDGLFGYDPILGAATLAHTGQMAELDGHGLRMLTVPISTPDLGGRPMAAGGNDDGIATMLTDSGEVVFRASISGGTGTGPAIASVRIPTASGACCSGSSCSVAAQLDCGGVSTRFVGVNTTCDVGGARTLGSSSCCPADFDQSGDVGTQDLFDFLAAWMVRDGKANADGVADVGLDDLMSFLVSYLGGC